MTPVIAGVGLLAPGLPSWAEAQPQLRGERPFRWDQVADRYPPDLPPAERRRTTALIRLALAAAAQAVAEAGCSENLQSVFSSSHGDMAVCDAICRALSSPDRPVSPTQFHNSVHNAPTGYWSLASGVRAPSTSISHPNGAAAGLLEAWTQVRAEQAPVLLVCCEYPGPPPIGEHAGTLHPHALALLLQPGGTGVELALQLTPEAADFTESVPLEWQRPLDPQFRRWLPLLALLARGSAGRAALPYQGKRQLWIEVGGS